MYKRMYFSLFHVTAACDKSCKKGCSGPGPKNCDECAKGYVREDAEEGSEEKGECEGDSVIYSE